MTYAWGMGRLGTVALVGGLGLAGLAALALAYPHDPVSGWDEATATWVATHMPRALEQSAEQLSRLGGLAGLAAVCAVVCGLLAWRRRWLDGVLVVVSLVGIQLVVVALKGVFERPRPDLDPAIALPASSAFPSGHAAGAVAVLGLLAVVGVEQAGPRARFATGVGVVALSLAIGASRVVLGVHHPSDVVAGWCLGVAWLIGLVLVRQAFRRAPHHIPLPDGRPLA